MKVLSVASEAVPLVKTGGLADVVGALPRALAGQGVEMRVMLPAYRGLAARLEGTRAVDVPLGSGPAARVLSGTVEGMAVLLVDAPDFYDRLGNPYTGPDGRDWPDNALRFAHLARVGAAVARAGLEGWLPDAVHVHDWQAGLLPAYLAAERVSDAPPCLVTIHNIAFQGLFPASVLPALDLPPALFTPEGIEFHGHVGFLKAGLALARRISTVSPTYAREVMRPAFGHGLDGLLRHRAAHMTGILNGIDLDGWDPSGDPALAAPYTVATAQRGKAANRAALARRFGLDADRRLGAAGPLFIVVSRMTDQKGLDLLLDVLPGLVARGGRLALLGSGEPALEAGFQAAARAHPGRVGVVIGYDEPLSHLMQAGGDAILVPSRFEPCGLTQLYALRYGTVPVVARTGGLADTVIDANDAGLRAGVATGLLHDADDAGALSEAIRRACDLHARRPVWAAMRRCGMRHPVGWETAAAEYAALYAAMLEETRA
jgi:starch synthase